MAMATVQLFLRASASAAAIIFFAPSSVICFVVLSNSITLLFPCAMKPVGEYNRGDGDGRQGRIFEGLRQTEVLMYVGLVVDHLSAGPDDDGGTKIRQPPPLVDEI